MPGKPPANHRQSVRSAMPNLLDGSRHLFSGQLSGSRVQKWSRAVRERLAAVTDAATYQRRETPTGQKRRIRRTSAITSHAIGTMVKTCPPGSMK